MEIKLIYCTAGSREEAQGIAEKVVHERLAACANILPAIQSVYQWEGRMQQAEEEERRSRGINTVLGSGAKTRETSWLVAGPTLDWELILEGQNPAVRSDHKLVN